MRRKLHPDLTQTIMNKTVEVSNYKELDFQEKVLLACGKIWISEESKYIDNFEVFNTVIDVIKENLTFCEFIDEFFDKTGGTNETKTNK